MRVKLTVNRQGLPPVRVLWDADTLRPNHTGSGANTTVAQLLEQINEIIPLEAEDWGLEDYLVEVNGFECLHFCSLNILKEDDQVIVRPLQTSDIRHRRVSGRHQITADGRHLIDGVAFGRPFLKRSERPPIKIPPRKRVRLTYGAEEDNESASLDYNTERALVPILNDSDDDDVDFAADPNSQGSESGSDAADEESDNDADVNGLTQNKAFRDELAMEAEYLSKDIDEFPGGQSSKVSSTLVESPSRRRRSKRKPGVDGLGLYGDGVLELLETDGEVLIGGYHNPLLDQYYNEEPVQSTTISRKRKRAREVDVQPSETRPRRSKPLAEISRRSSTASTKSVRFQGDEVETPATVREVEDSDSEDDEDFEPESRESSNSQASNKENIEPRNAIGESTEYSTELQLDSSDSSDSSDTESDSSYTSSSLSSSSDELSSPKSAQSPVKSISNDTPVSKPVMDVLKNAPSRSDTSDQPLTFTPPNKGLHKTKKRNERRKQHNKLLYLKKIGVLASNATLEDYQNYMKDRVMDSSQSHKEEQADEQAAFEEKRQRLLDSIASGGIALDQDLGDQQVLDKPDHEAHTDGSARPASKPINEAQPTLAELPNPSDPNHSVASMDPPTDHSDIPASLAQPSERRSKLDLASSRRLLFGSLGLRTPKTKEDEQRLREKMTESAKSLPRNRGNADDRQVDLLSIGDDSWTDGIILEAVECCHEGVKLSTPPFPFVQRWDPQQQGGFYDGEYAQNKNKRNKRKKKGKSGNQEMRRGINSYWANDQYEPVEYEDEEPEAAHVASDDYQRAVDNQLLQDATGSGLKPTSSTDDLPEVPAEVIAYCESLVPETALPGAVIAFKQLDMSQETNWQPAISDYRTAKITNVSEDGILEISFAQRDRVSNKRTYDEETGERLYSKFEMPDYEDAIVGDTDGVLEIGFTDLIEPKLVVRGEPKACTPVMAPADVPESSYVDAPEISSIVATEAQIVAPEVSHMDTSAIETIDMSEMVSVTSQEDDEYEPQEANVSFAESNHEPETTAPGVAEDLPVRVRQEAMIDEPVKLNEQTRQEISMIIKDAGFRSDVHSDLGKGLEQLASNIPPSSAHTKVSAPPSNVSTPRYNGFTSSPPAEESSRYADIGHDETAQSQSYSKNTTTIVDMESSEPNELARAAEDLPPLSDPMDDSWRPDQLDEDSLPYPSLPNSYTDSRDGDRFNVEDDVEPPAISTARINQRTRKSTRASTLFSSARRSYNPDFEEANNASSDEELPSLADIFSTARSKLDSSAPESNVGDEHQRASQQATARTRAHQPMRYQTSDGEADRNFKVEKLTHSSNGHNPNQYSDAEDEGDHTTGISTIQSKNGGSRITNRQLSDQLLGHMSKGFSVSDIFASSSPRIDSPDPDKAVPERGFQPLPRRSSRQPSRQASLPPPGSQVVDLTLSSDPVGPDEDEPCGMPSGPGWVRKSVLKTKKLVQGKRKEESRYSF